ncbi:MAG TPA: hypothetical protein VMV14_00320, partial [Acidimicrobiales bacterium]|nr:hypothetical protein [Acidimicrobiales bacterium]
MTPAGRGAPSRRVASVSARPASRRPDVHPRGFERRPAPPARLVTPRQRLVTGAVPKRRVGTMRVVVLVAFVALALRLFAVQVLSGGHYAAIGAAEVTSTVQVPAVRGGIYDRNGAVLALSVPRSTVVADPFLIVDPGQEAAVLARVLNVPVAVLTAEMS